MAKIIVHIDGLSPYWALNYVQGVIDNGLVSETAAGKQYAFHTEFTDGVTVTVTKNKNSQTFYVRKKNETT